MSPDPIPQSLHQLAHLSQQIRQQASELPAYSRDFGGEHIRYVMDTSVSIGEKLRNIAQTCLAAASSGSAPINPLVNRDVRHDMRNLIAVVKGFSELMQMDISPGHPADTALRALCKMSDEFVIVLDQIKANSGEDMAAAAAG